MEVTNRLFPTTDEQKRSFGEPGPDGPVVMVNLFKFRDRARYPDGSDSELTGGAAFGRYYEVMERPIFDHGGRANNCSAVDGYDAYFGRYWIDETGEAIVVHLEGSITAANAGQEFTRVTRASDVELVIRLETTTDDNIAITRTLTFQRLP